MESRMERYDEVDINDYQRSKKNATLYKEIYGNYSDLEDLPIPENTNEIEIDSLNSIVGSRVSKRKEEVKNQDYELEDLEDNHEDSEKVYDINELLEKAKVENAKVKKEVTVNKNMPNYLANLESDKSTKDIISKYDGNDDDDMPIIKEVVIEEEANDKKGDSTLSLDILSDLKPSGNTLVSEPMITEEDIKENQDKEFFSSELKFDKKDFAKGDDDEEFFEEENNHTFLKVILIIIGLSSLFTAIYFILKEYTNIF
ncbi:MAG: hypothetical protein MR550_05770 [Bacilli bacterium]|nr:hypothetical protein [Bacilli bacterium]